MVQFKQKQIREMQDMATDITNITEPQLNKIISDESGLETIGLSFGVYGMNGGVFKGNKTQQIYIIVGRATNLFRLA